MHFQSTARIAAMIILCCGVGIISGLFTGDTIGGWYGALRKPPLNPPSWVFGVIWPILYIMMGIAAGLVWNKQPEQHFFTAAMEMFLFQLLLNGLWTPLFFKLHAIGWALAELLLLWIVILVTVIIFYRLFKVSGILLLPYLTWVSFAIYLNAGFLVLNR